MHSVFSRFLSLSAAVFEFSRNSLKSSLCWEAQCYLSPTQTVAMQEFSKGEYVTSSAPRCLENSSLGSLHARTSSKGGRRCEKVCNKNFPNEVSALQPPPWAASRPVTSEGHSSTRQELLQLHTQERLTTSLLTLTLMAASSLVAIRTVRGLSRTPSYLLLCLRFWRQNLHWPSDPQCPCLGLWVQQYQHVPPSSGSNSPPGIFQCCKEPLVHPGCPETK